MKSIGQAKRDFAAAGEDVVYPGFRNAVEAMLRDNFEGSFSNDCYTDALFLTKKMLEQCAKQLRVLSGADCDGFFSLLASDLRAAVARIKGAGGKVRIVRVVEGEGTHPEAEFLGTLVNEYPGTVEMRIAQSAKPVGHFMVVDDEILRVEEPHGPLTPETPEDAIKARVFFRKTPDTAQYSGIFERIWSRLTVAP